MKYLLDTHALLWSAFNKAQVSSRAKRILSGSANQVVVSAASAWEIATKFRLGKLPQAQILVSDFVSIVSGAGFLLLPVSAEHALRAGLLPGNHRDPFDRMLAAQALQENMPLISDDSQFESFGVRRIW